MNKALTRGLALSIGLGLIALFGAPVIPGLNGVILALLLGILIRNSISLPQHFEEGISFSSTKFLEISILFLALGIDYNQISNLGLVSFIGLSIMVFIMLTVTYFMAKWFKCPTNTGILVGFGTAICGSSAIAALAPTLENSEKEDVAISMAVVNLFGTLGMIGLPLLLGYLEWNDTQIGMMVGGSLHSVGNVAGAGFAIGKDAGDIAITVKLARVALLTPGLIYLNFLNQKGKETSSKNALKLPWYLIGFIAISIINSIVQIPTEILSPLSHTGKIILTVSMAAIGLKVSFKKLLNIGKRGLRFGLVSFFVQMFIMLAIITWLI